MFIVGCGRSGTTLLRVILNRHSQMAIPLEGLFILDYLLADPRLIDRMRRLVLREYELHEWNLDLDLRDLEDCSHAAQMIARIHQRYAEKHGKQNWGHKTPRLVRHWSVIKTSYPNAKFVHVVRDPRAVAHSQVKSDVHRATYYHAARRWSRDVASGIELESSLPKDSFRVRYEDLIENPENVIGNLCDFIGLDYEPGLLLPKSSDDTDYGAFYVNIHEMVSSQISSNRTDAWKQEMSAEDVRIVDTVAGHLYEGVGYPRRSSRASLRSSDPIIANAKGLAKLPGRLFHYGTLRRGYLLGVLRRKRLLQTLSIRDISYLFS